MAEGEEYREAAGADEVAEGALCGVQLAHGERVCLFRIGGELGAVSDVCPHAEFLMSDGILHAAEGEIECAWHGARFDLRTGAVRRGPADAPLPVYEVRERGGRVFVRAARRGRESR